MKLKIKAVSSTIEGIEELINEYFYSQTYYLELLKERKLKFEIRNRKGNIPFDINKEYKVDFKKGRYYFYKVIEDGCYSDKERKN